MREAEPTTRDAKRPYWKRLADRLPWYALVIVGAAAVSTGGSAWTREQALAKGIAFALLGAAAVGIAWLVGKLVAIRAARGEKECGAAAERSGDRRP